MLLLGGMRDTRSASMRFTGPRGRADAPPIPPRRSTRSSAPPPYEPKISAYGFKIMTEEEEAKLKKLEGRIRANVDIDHQALQVLGFEGDINGMMNNLGWRQFSEGINVGVQVDIALEMFMTMHAVTRRVQGQDVPCLDFRLKDEDTFITFDAIGSLLGFKNDAPSECELDEGDDIDEFWEKIAKDKRRVRSSISNIIIQIFHSWMSKRILGRMREIKVTQVEENWLYSALVGRQAINPSRLMVERWLCEATSGSGDIGSGCYLTLIANFVNPRIEGVQNFYLKGCDFGISALTQGHYIGGDEKNGFFISNTSVSLPDPRLHLFAQGRTNWRDEYILVKQKKDKKRRNVGSTSAPAQDEVEVTPPANSEFWRGEFQHGPSGGVPAERSWEGPPMSSWGGAPSQAWGGGVPMNNPPPPSTYNTYDYGPQNFSQGDTSLERQYAHLPQPERGVRIMGAYADRTFENCDEMRRRADMVENDTASLTYQFGALGLVTPQQYQGGASQQYYEQGYYSTHPYEEGPPGEQI